MQVDTTTCDANASLKPTMFIQVQWLNQFGSHLSVFYMFVTLNCVDPQFKSMFVAEVNEIHHNLTLFLGLQHPLPRPSSEATEDTFDVVLRTAQIQRFCEDWQLAAPQGGDDGMHIWDNYWHSLGPAPPH